MSTTMGRLTTNDDVNSIYEIRERGVLKKAEWAIFSFEQSLESHSMYSCPYTLLLAHDMLDTAVANRCDQAHTDGCPTVSLKAAIPATKKTLSWSVQRS